MDSTLKLTKSDILSLPHLESIGFDELKAFEITGVSIDSRTTKRGELFIAIHGNQFDGHNFISKAIEAGAACVIVERRWTEANAAMIVSIHIPRIVVGNTIHALGHLAKIYRKKFAIPFIAIGGSNGKTTTKEMIKSILGTKYRVLSTEGNLNNHIGVPQTLFRLEKKHEIAIIEIGTNHPGEIEYLCSILEPTHGLITNIGHEHLEFFNNLQGVAQAEGELFDWLTAHNGISLVNVDDKHLLRLAKKMKKKVCFGFTPKSNSIKGTIISSNGHGQILLRIKPLGKKAFNVAVSMPGKHNAENALAAVTVGLAMRVQPAKIQKALVSFQPASMRMQIHTVAGVTILNDAYNANPDSMLAALAALRIMKSKGKKIAVLGDMLELGVQSDDLHQKIGRALSKYHINILLTFGPHAKSIHDTASVETKAHFDSKPALAEYLLHTFADGDIVLIKGSREMKMEEIITALSERQAKTAGA